MLDKLRRNLRDIGIGATLLYTLDRALAAISGGRAHVYAYLLVAQPIGPALAPMRPDPKVRIEPAGADHEAVAAFPRPAHIIRQRFDAGARCLVALQGGSYAGYLWWQRGHYDEDEVRCRFEMARAEEAVWDFDVYVEPRLRLGRTMARLWDEAARRWHAEGVRWSYSRISAFNAASIASHARLGLRPLGRAVFIVAGGWQLGLFSGPPYVHLSFGTASRPTVVLHPPPDGPGRAV